MNQFDIRNPLGITNPNSPNNPTSPISAGVQLLARPHDATLVKPDDPLGVFITGVVVGAVIVMFLLTVYVANKEDFK